MFGLPLEINHYIRLFLLDRSQLLTKTNNVWCHCCGEKTTDEQLCDMNKCRDCCRLQCLDGSNYYRNYTNVPPYRDDQIEFVLRHHSRYI